MLKFLFHLLQCIIFWSILGGIGKLCKSEDVTGCLVVVGFIFGIFRLFGAEIGIFILLVLFIVCIACSAKNVPDNNPDISDY